jgi:hypothetical protein
MTFKDAAIVLAVAVVCFLGGHFLWPRPATQSTVIVHEIDSLTVDSLSVVIGELQAQSTMVRTQAVTETAKRQKAERLYAALLVQLQHPDTVGEEWPAAAFDTTVVRYDSVTVVPWDTTRRAVTLATLRTVRMWGEYWLPPQDKFVNLGTKVSPYRVYYDFPTKIITKETVDKVWAWEPIVGASLIAILLTLFIIR